MTTPDAPDPAGVATPDTAGTPTPDPAGAPAPDPALAVVPVPGSAADPDDIIDAEIVEDPPPAPPAAQPAAPQVGPESAPKAANIPFAAPPVPAVPVDPITDYTDDGVPTFSYLQDKVEKRYATALGSHELADATIPQVQQAAKRREELAKSAEERLAEIRRSLHPDG